MSRTTFIVLLLLASVLAMVFVALNPQLVTVEIAVQQLHVRQGVVLMIAFVMGLLAGVLLRIQWIAELLRERGRLRRALKIAETRVRAATTAEPDR